MRARRYRARIHQSRDAEKCGAGQRRLRVKRAGECDAAERARRGGESENRAAESDGDRIRMRKRRKRKNLRRNAGEHARDRHRREIVEKPVATRARHGLAIARAQQTCDRDRRERNARSQSPGRRAATWLRPPAAIAPTGRFRNRSRETRSRADARRRTSPRAAPPAETASLPGARLRRWRARLGLRSGQSRRLRPQPRQKAQVARRCTPPPPSA